MEFVRDHDDINTNRAMNIPALLKEINLSLTIWVVADFWQSSYLGATTVTFSVFLRYNSTIGYEQKVPSINTLSKAS